MSYDYTVLAGTQGMRNHLKKDRLFELAQKRRLPLVLFAEGGGGRPGDVDWPHVAGLDCRAFDLFAQLSGLVPLVGIASGFCFAGNAALLGCCDVVIASEDSSIGMGGPAMIEGGGPGGVRAEDVGPIDVQWTNGVVDLRVKDDAEAVHAAKRYLSYFKGPSEPAEPPEDQAALRHLIPTNRKRIYDVRRVIHVLLDDVLELRRGFGHGMVTALARVGGKPLGVIANDPSHLGGAIDAHAADKAARFMQLCDAFELPILSLCDTPGFMVGPPAERTATVRHFARMFVTGANFQARSARSCSARATASALRRWREAASRRGCSASAGRPRSSAGWGSRARCGGDAPRARGDRGRAGARARLRGDGRRRLRARPGINMAAYGEIDDVIDPADSRRWIETLFSEDSGQWWKRPEKKRRLRRRLVTISRSSRTRRGAPPRGDRRARRGARTRG